MIPFSWQRQVACLMRLIFIHPSKGGALKQKKKEEKKEYLNKLRLCLLAAFTLYNRALFARFEYSNAHLSVKPFSGKLL